MKFLLVSVYSRRVSERKTSRSASIEPKTFVINRARVHGYLNIRDRLYCVDGFAGWDPKNPFNIRRHLFTTISSLFNGDVLIRCVLQSV